MLLSRLSLVLVIVAAGAGCGGKATEGSNDPGRGGAPAGGGSANQAGSAPVGAPSVVEVSGDIQASVADAAAECLSSFQGFVAKAGGTTIDFKAFIQEPGDYRGDPLRILWLDVQQPDGSAYSASTGAADATGSILLHVETVSPRFTGNIEATLTNRGDPAQEPLQLQLSFDIAARAGCD